MVDLGPAVLDHEFVDILVCPRSKQPLVYFPRGAGDDDEAQAFLLSPAACLRYRIVDGVPVMLPEEAEQLTATATASLVDRARALGLRVST
ncbi:MAG: hypothetical protein KF773_25750 [Deltaproteobacteria bacterium]|nr:hypothetical protein [Deltaproteobacteria bacterium]MCW5803521.1 hypothetical protein [Deltaproteobacteria bacterium]